MIWREPLVSVEQRCAGRHRNDCPPLRHTTAAGTAAVRGRGSHPHAPAAGQGCRLAGSSVTWHGTAAVEGRPTDLEGGNASSPASTSGRLLWPVTSPVVVETIGNSSARRRWGDDTGLDVNFNESSCQVFRTREQLEVPRSHVNSKLPADESESKDALTHRHVVLLPSPVWWCKWPSWRGPDAPHVIVERIRSRQALCPSYGNAATESVSLQRQSYQRMIRQKTRNFQTAADPASDWLDPDVIVATSVGHHEKQLCNVLPSSENQSKTGK